MRRAFWFAAPGVTPSLALALALALIGTAACKGKDDKQSSADKAAKGDAPQTAPQTGQTAGQTGQEVGQTADTGNAAGLAKRYQECLSSERAKDYDKLATCYTDDAVATSVDFLPPSVVEGKNAIIAEAKDNREQFPDSGFDLQLLLVKNDKELVSVGLTYARQAGEGGAGDLKIGVLSANHSVMNAQGAVLTQDLYLDQGTLLSQIGATEMPARKAVDPNPAPPVVVVAEGSDTEAKNLAIVADMHKAMNVRDAAKVMAFYADDFDFLNMSSPDDLKGKDKVMPQLSEYFALSTDMKFNPDWVWAAGDYVVAGITTKGTNNGALPGGIEASGEPFETHQVDVYQLRDGKIGKQWLFTNGYAFAVQLGFLPDPTEGDEGDEDE